jgi:hypothetical protein
MIQANFQKKLSEIENQQIKSLLESYWRHNRKCRDYRVYESAKRQVSQIAKGDWLLYEKSIYILTEILEI